MKKGVIILSVILLIISGFSMLTNPVFKEKMKFTGLSFTDDQDGGVRLIIGISAEIITIYSPQNITYYFAIGQNYTLDLNVSANFNTSAWWYVLEDIRHNETVRENITFTPNTTFDAVRWTNRLIVYANRSDNGVIGSQDVYFYISVPNSAPWFSSYIPDEDFVCEASDYELIVNATDLDEDVLSFDISPKNPIFIFKFGRINRTTEGAIVESAIINKDRLQNYSETLSVTDGQYLDTKTMKIVAIERNNPPEMEPIGTQTVWTYGDNTSFYYEVQVEDIESGNQSSGEYNFSLEFFDGPDLFNISQYGIMNFTPNSSQIGVYKIRVCANDTGLSNPHANITDFCGQDGSSQKDCQNFSLTVTDQNRPPTILNYYPFDLVFNATATITLEFNITKYDPDGTIPDTYWYLDNQLEEIDYGISGNYSDYFSFAFPCGGVSGLHTVEVIVTDGALNDSLTWVIDLRAVPCPFYVEPAAPPAFGEAPQCRELWVCADWSICQNAKIAADIGELFMEDYRFVQFGCNFEQLNTSVCGYQIRQCFDLHNCNTSYTKPTEVQHCYYTPAPSCSDRIKNCHNGSCELLIDCGGPCPPCPTCSDKIRNQGEEGIDCGGPCPWVCPPEAPFKLALIKFLRYLLALLIAALIMIILIKINRIRHIKKKIKQYE